MSDEGIGRGCGCGCGSRGRPTWNQTMHEERVTPGLRPGVPSAVGGRPNYGPKDMLMRDISEYAAPLEGVDVWDFLPLWWQDWDPFEPRVNSNF